MLYRINNGTVSVGGNEVLSHIDFEIKDREKIAIVGRNGAGKTTLLRLIAGELELDRDDKRMQRGITTSRKLTIGMLRQSQKLDEDKSIDELLRESMPVFEPFSKEQFEYETEYDRIFTGLGFQMEQKKKKLGTFSGGEQTKITLIRLLLQKPDILLLDEPTNHLDIQTVEWLEEYLREYPHAVVMVSHDRFFLDRVAEVIYEVAGSQLKRFAGNYTDYRKQKQKNLAIAKRKYEEQQAEIRRLNDLIEKFKHKPKKAAFARSRKKILERMERIEKPEECGGNLFVEPIVPEVRGSKWVWESEHLKVGYENALFEVTMKVRRGQKIAVIGENGSGKSTLLKTVIGEIQGISGKSILGNNIVVGYFDQQSAAVSSENSVFEHFHKLYPSLSQKDARNILGAYLFSGKSAQIKVDALSGGEKARLVLAEILTGKPNFLVLDEPTNHMDIQAKEVLETAFSAYEGTMLFVSHDRYFVDQVADALLVIENGQVFYYPFGYTHYIGRKKKARIYGTGIAAQVAAEDQALIADMRAVPKREHHESRQLSTEEAYVEWKLGLMQEPVDEITNRIEVMVEKKEQASAYEEWCACEEEINRLWEQWNDACMRWLEGYEELESEQ